MDRCNVQDPRPFQRYQRAQQIFKYRIYIFFINHLDQLTSWVNWSVGPKPAHAHTPLTKPIGSARHNRSICSTRPDRVDWPACACALTTQSFFIVAQSFYYIVNHFAVINWTILFHWTQSFFYRKRIHFARVNSTILSESLKISAQSFCCSEIIHFFTLLSYFMILL
jgi:hypothetical protein